jgi:predicted TIM-barrel fold metal-dependent hydrolase
VTTTYTDNTLFALIADTLDAASALAGWNYVTVQRDQPSPQGAVTVGTVYLERQFDDRYGWPAVSSQYNPPNPNTPPNPQGTYTKTELQWIEARFQVSAMVIQNPADLTIPTALDVVRQAAQYMNARSIVKTLKRTNGVSILKVGQVRNPWDKDDRDIYEATPSFDLVVQYQAELDFTVPATNIVKETGIYPV